jgi:conjugal transfer/entry exclusion protein
MKSLALATALTLLAAPASACGTGGFIQVGNQVACIRAATPQEMQARRSYIQSQNSRRDAEDRVREAAAEMDRAADAIMAPGGRQRYRDALDNYTDARVEQDRLKRGY